MANIFGYRGQRSATRASWALASSVLLLHGWSTPALTAEPGLNRVEINGVTVLSLTVGGGRDVDFRDLPVDFVSRLEVHKSSTPEMTEGGIGGTVRVITRRPLDSAEPYLAGSTQMIYSDLAREYDPKLAIIGSRTFLNNTLGILGAATYEERHLDSHNARTTGWLRRAPTASGPGATPGRGTDVNGDGTLDWIPEILRYGLDRRETKRPAFLGIVEWAPSEAVKVFAEGTYEKAKERVSSMLMQLSAATGLIDYASSVVGPDNTVTHREVIPSAQFPPNLLNDQRIEHNTPLRRIGNETYGLRYFLGVRARL